MKNINQGVLPVEMATVSVCVSARESVSVCFLSMYPMNTWVLIGAPGLSDPF